VESWFFIEEIKIERPEPLQPCLLVIESRLQSETESSNFETGVNIPFVNSTHAVSHGYLPWSLIQTDCLIWVFTMVLYIYIYIYHMHLPYLQIVG
jgi:hypothetical protein